MTGTVQSTETERIRALVTDHVQALQDGDVRAVVDCYAEGAVSFDLRPPLRYASPRATRIEDVQNWLTGFAGPVRVEVRDLDVTTDGDVAFCHSLNALTATPYGSPEPFTLWYRATLGLRRVDGRWRITHEHKSTPFHMEMDENFSFRAAVDLTPEGA